MLALGFFLGLTQVQNKPIAKDEGAPHTTLSSIIAFEKLLLSTCDSSV